MWPPRPDPAFTSSWRDYALCAEVGDVDVWFPEKGESPQDAKKVCSSCEVRAACLEYALATRQPYGVWGGLTEHERRPLLRGELPNEAAA
ncbi:WhiB family transcriptional regulator [Streptosporangium jomthongense]|uniref:Transcriptional regulator WhiB n=1 Tax=Streptosporangium jomthongense TaxID=1193683 RepID=A0ABV8F408_9ACTN